MKARLAQKESNQGISAKATACFCDCSLHAHDFYELDIITGGEALTAINGKDETARRGKAYFMTPEDLHEYPTDSQLDILNIQFYGDDVCSPLLRSIAEGGRRSFVLSEDTLCSVEALHSVLLCISGSTKPREEARQRIVEAILCLLLDTLKENEIEAREAAPDIQRALLYIEEHFKDCPTLGEVAAHVMLNERYFCKIFKEYTGKTFKEYIREKRLRYAKKLILSTSYPILEISETCGYNTQSHFNREFKARYGTSPLALRREK
ncbi:MAG: helix-turn-helix domain-containing protein [Clostridia bacterium]|nr:helix-turn-helix domain-containing protein [Clostridia bacterium]